MSTGDIGQGLSAERSGDAITGPARVMARTARPDGGGNGSPVEFARYSGVGSPAKIGTPDRMGRRMKQSRFGYRAGPRCARGSIVTQTPACPGRGGSRTPGCFPAAAARTARLVVFAAVLPMILAAQDPREIALLRGHIGVEPEPGSLLAAPARLTISRLPLADALTRLSQQARVQIAFSRTLLPSAHRRMRLRGPQPCPHPGPAPGGHRPWLRGSRVPGRSCPQGAGGSPPYGRRTPPSVTHRGHPDRCRA